MNHNCTTGPGQRSLKTAFIFLLLPLFGFIGTASAQTNIEFWDMVWGPPQYIDVATGLVDQFNAENPDIQVEYRSVPWNNWYQTFLTAIGSGTAPDISTGAAFIPVQLYDMGAIEPIDEVVAELRDEGQLDDYVPGVVDFFKYDGHNIALPWSIGTRSWYYRKSLFEEAGIELPTTWEEFRAATEALTGDGQYGIVGSQDSGGTHYLYTLVVNNGGGLFTETGEPDFMDPRNLEAFRFFSDLAQSGVMHPASAGYTSGDAQSAFARGDAAIVLAGPGLVNQFPEIADDIGVLPPLEGPSGDKGTFRALNGIMVYKQSEHPEAAKTFLKWWAEHEKPLWIDGGITGNIPARQSFVADPFFQENPNTAMIIDEYIPVAQAIGAKYPSIFPELNVLDGEGFMQTLVQDLLQGKDLMASVEKANARFSDVMKDLSLGE